MKTIFIIGAVALLAACQPATRAQIEAMQLHMHNSDDNDPPAVVQVAEAAPQPAPAPAPAPAPQPDSAPAPDPVEQVEPEKSLSEMSESELVDEIREREATLDANGGKSGEGQQWEDAFDSFLEARHEYRNRQRQQ